MDTRRQSRKRLVICKCQSYCSTWDPISKKYIGNGQIVTRWTKDNHSRDDRIRRLATETRLNQPPQSRSSNPITIPRASNHNWLQLVTQEVNILSSLPVSSFAYPLEFLYPPSPSGEYNHGIDWRRPNTGIYALKSDRRANAAFLQTEFRISDLLSILSSMPATEASTALSLELEALLRRLDREKELHWMQQQFRNSDFGNKPVVNTEIYYYSTGPSDPTKKAALLVTAVLQSLYFVSRRTLRVYLSGLKDLLVASGIPSQEVDDLIPKDPRTAASLLRIDPVTRTYISCPTCHTLYPYLANENPGGPSQCLHRETPTSVHCNTPLWKEINLAGRCISAPRVKYCHQDFGHWLGRLLSRKGVESILESYPAELQNRDPHMAVSDIWLAEVFRELRGCDGTPFLDTGTGEGKLVFGMSVDSFETHGAKPGKLSCSSTGIWLFCYNFPDHLRYIPEHMYLAGVIPGKPSTHHINPYLQLVVDDFKPFWSSGIFFSRTYSCATGRTFKGWLLPLICDMLGARQVAGCASVTAHYFCTVCDIDYNDIDILNPEEWPLKDPRHWRRVAELWRDAHSEEDREIIFNAFGHRWTPLLELPYWDPVRFTVIDTMHALDINLLKQHLRNFFRISLRVDVGGDGSSDSSKVSLPDKLKIPSDEVKALSRCRVLIADNEPGLLFKLVEFHRTILYVICVENSILGPSGRQVIGTRWILARNIYHWRQNEEEESVQAFIQKVEGSASSTPSPDERDHDRDHNDGDTLDNQAEDERGDIDPGPEDPASDPYSDIAQFNKTIRFILRYIDRENGASEVTRQSSITVSILEQICDAIDIDHSTIIERTRKSLLTEAIFDKMDYDDLALASLNSYLASASRSSTPSTIDLGDPDSVDIRKLRRAISSMVACVHDETAKERLLRRNPATNAILERICQMIDIDSSIIVSKGRRLLLAEAIIDKIRDNDELFGNLSSHLPDVSHHRVVLGKDVMEAIWEDMERTQLPSYLSRVPRNWRSTTQLSADQTRVLCTVHLPITLIRLWYSDTDRKQQLLANYMDLVTAVLIANMRITSPQHIAAYNRHIQRYMTHAQQLYTDAGIKPHHHAALHIGSMLEWFGPVHAHSAVYYERHIGFLRRIRINKKPGDSEQTFMSVSARNANLRAMLADDLTLRDRLHNMMGAFAAIAIEETRGFNRGRESYRFDDLEPRHSPPEYKLGSRCRSPDESHHSLLSQLLIDATDRALRLSTALFYDEIFIRGIPYGCSGSLKSRNSPVIFYRTENSQPLPGIIDHIFQYEDDSAIFIALRSFRCIHPDSDPYRRYGSAAGYLCHVKDMDVYVVPASKILSHCALTYMKTDSAHALVHILPLDRVVSTLPENESLGFPIVTS